MHSFNLLGQGDRIEGYSLNDSRKGAGIDDF
jgi:hypothetical protein